ncbi:MAG: TIGR03557 family F420-dependent LLM class oxidoreductase [Candidatus Rokuibacteriota bacterium]
MMEIGYKLCSEEHGPRDLVRFARRAEEVGFTFAMISDHFHPWTDSQGQSPFVWGVLGAVAQATERLRAGTGVTCPTIRTHPAIIAHAAATAAALMPGRFLLGVGTGENLNEHILGDRWPPAEVRREMLQEAIEVIRLLWRGGLQDHRGRHYTVENARLYTLPNEPPPILVAASGEKAAELAGRLGDGLIATAADRKLVQTFRRVGGGGKPRFAEVTVCWARDEAAARRTARERWPIAALSGPLVTELALPSHFEAAAEPVTDESIARAIVCGPDPERHVEAVRRYVEAGYDHLWIHQVGPDQEGFFDFYRREVLPRLTGRRGSRRLKAAA